MKTMMRFTALIFLLNNIPLQAQQPAAAPDVFAMVRQAVPAPARPVRHGTWVTSSPNELQWVLGGLFWGYKNFLSSQDRPGCQFYPSCSEYAVASIRKHGVLIGSMAAFDRLSRCNGLSPDQYEKHPANKRFVDTP